MALRPESRAQEAQPLEYHGAALINALHRGFAWSNIRPGTQETVKPQRTITMGKIDKAKEIVTSIVEMATTAGIKKDVIDLLKEKVTVLASQLTEAQAKVANLEIENAQLRAQVRAPAVVARLDDVSKKALQCFCDCNRVVTIQELAGHLSCQESKAEYICDELYSRKFIRMTNIPSNDPRWDPVGDNSGYEVTPQGRKLCFTEPDKSE